MEVLTKSISEMGVMIVITAVFLWQYIVDKNERKIERKAQSEQHDRMIEVVANNNAVVRQNSQVLKEQKDFNGDVKDKLTQIEKGVADLHSMIKDHNAQSDEIFQNLINEINQLKKS